MGRGGFKLNLICLPLQGLDIILGMIWLSSNYILKECGTRELVFPNSKSLELVVKCESWNKLKSGTKCYVILSHMVETSEG